MIKKIIALFLAVLAALSLVCCGENEKESGGPETEPGTGTEPVAQIDDYLKEYGDTEKAAAWIKKNITDAVCPPVNFSVGGINSDQLSWSKETSETTEVTDYPDTAPVKRSYYTVRFTCEEKKIAVDIVVTNYPGYPVVEYEATLVNLADGNSERIKNLYSIYSPIWEKEDATVRYYNGSSIDGESDYVEKTFAVKSADGSKAKKVSMSVDNGKPTSTYLQSFSIESAGGDGVIGMISWQGSWKTDIELDDSGINMRSGQYRTDFNLLKGETHRFPAVVLLYYKKDIAYGQNVYRRWFYNHNFMRVRGEKTGLNVLVSTGVLIENSGLIDVQGAAKYDKLALRGVKAYDFQNSIDRFAQDAGWTQYGNATSWGSIVGTWKVDETRYPKGLKEVADAAAELGLGYTLWLEPERCANGQEISKEHPEYIIFIREQNGKTVYTEKIGRGADGLVNIGKPEVCEYITDMLDKIITDCGVTTYRQDFNFYPAPYWSAYDAHEEKELGGGIKRVGRTEEQYCNGYLKVFDTLIERHPGLEIDACASGGMRYDLATARRAHCHTRTDWFGTSEKAQSDTYVTSKWMVYWGTSFSTKSDYALRSRIAGDIGIGIIAADDTYDYKGNYQVKSAAIKKWRNLGKYIFEDYYPLTDYINKDAEGVVGLQYDCPSNGTGMVIAYVRGLGFEKVLKPYALDPDAEYVWYDLDDAKNMITVTGKELTETGFTVASGDENEMLLAGDNGISKVFIYEKKN